MKKIFNYVLILFFILILVLIIFNLINIKKDNNNKENSHLKQNSNYIFNNFKMSINYDKMTWHNNIYWCKIDSYEKYLEFKDEENILEMKKEDFENKFMILTAIENTSMQRLTLSQVFKENDTLYIGLSKVPNSKKFDEENNAISIILDDSYKASNIDVFKTIDNISNFSKKYANIKSIPADYSREQAINDNCIVDYSENIEIFEKFLENVKNGITDGVRIYGAFENDYICVQDITYLSDKKKFIVCIDSTRNPNFEQTYNYYEYTNMELLNEEEYPNFEFIYKVYKLTNENVNEKEFWLQISK